MIDARHYFASETLKDGTPVTIRAICCDDRDAIVAAFEGLDRESVYTRFFAYKKGLTEAELSQITEVDFDHVVALVVTTGTAEGERLIGGGRFCTDVALAAAERAELAFITSDDYRGRGVATLILGHLIQIGRDQGLLRFEAEVLAQNHAMLAVFRRRGLPMKERPEGSVVHVTLSLEAKPAVSP